jgi:hypothetical protein
VHSGRREHEDANRGGAQMLVLDVLGMSITPKIFWKYPGILLCGSGSAQKCKQQDMCEELDII